LHNQGAGGKPAFSAGEDAHLQMAATILALYLFDHEARPSNEKLAFLLL